MNPRFKTGAVLLAALAALSGNSLLAQRSLTATPISENFSTYLGSSATLPVNFSTEYTATSSPYQGTGNGSGSTVNSGLWAFSHSGGTGFGILEGDQGTGNLSNTGLFLNFKNNTGSALTRLRVSYKVQIWRDGARQNSIRLKYNTTNSGFSSLPDLANTPAKVNAGGDVAYNGNDPAYYTQVVAEFTLPASLANGSSAYLLWQYSTDTGSGRCDGLGIADIIVEALPAGTDKAWGGTAPANWNLTDAVWGGAIWSNTGDYNAVFNSGSGTLTLATGITAVDLKFNSTGYTIASGGNTLTLKGRIDVASGLTATVSAPLAGTSGLLKTGPGTLQLGGANTLTGTLAINDGTVKTLADNTVPSTSTVQLGATGKLDLNAYDLTVNGLLGDTLGKVIVPSGSTLTLDTIGSFSYDGDISGAGNLVKTGVGSQRLDYTEKNYSGTTTVSDGVLEVTENGVPTSTSAVTVSGGAELLLTTDVDYAPFDFGGPITLNNGHLAADTDAKVTLPDNIVIVGATGNAIYARGEYGGLDYEGSISGSGTFSKQGDGFLNLLADSTGFTGTFNINEGMFIVFDGVTFGNGATINVTEAGYLGGDGTINGNVAFADGSFALFLDGEQLDVTGNVTLTGDVEINADDLGSGTHTVLWAGGTISGTYTLTSTAGATVWVVSASPLAGYYVRVSVGGGDSRSWKTGNGNWDTSSSFWSGSVWINTSSSTAIFGGAPGTVTVIEPITAGDLDFTTGGYQIVGTYPLTLSGRINVNDSTGSVITAIITAPITGTHGLVKTGPDTLALGGTNTFTGTLLILDGTVKILSDAAVPWSSTVQLSNTGKLDLNGHNLTVNGLLGAALGKVIVPSGSTLTLATTGSFSYDGDISGAGNLVKTGVGNQRLDYTAKNYSGTTTVSGGVLEVTENGVPTSTSAVTVSGAAELLLTTDVDYAPFFFGGAITLNNGHLATDTDAKVVLPTNIVIAVATGNALYARGAFGALDYEGSISGSGTFSKQGDGLLNLMADSTGFTGTFNINDGMAIVFDGVTFGNGATVNVTETGYLGGDGTINGNVAFADGSFALFLDGEQLDVTGNVTLTGHVEINVEDLDNGTHTVLWVGGTIGGTYTLTSTAGTTVSVVSASPAAGHYVRITKPANPDTDANGLPDAWEMTHFGHLGVDPNADPDGDGLTNLSEYLVDSTPANAATPVSASTLDLEVYSP